ncbi:5-hydroxytryptamine (serotonin) receptor 3B [Cricetulus griseus]
MPTISRATPPGKVPSTESHTGPRSEPGLAHIPRQPHTGARPQPRKPPAARACSCPQPAGPGLRRPAPAWPAAPLSAEARAPLPSPAAHRAMAIRRPCRVVLLQLRSHGRGAPLRVAPLSLSSSSSSSPPRPPPPPPKPGSTGRRRPHVPPPPAARAGGPAHASRRPTLPNPQHAAEAPPTARSEGSTHPRPLAPTPPAACCGGPTHTLYPHTRGPTEAPPTHSGHARSVRQRPHPHTRPLLPPACVSPGRSFSECFGPRDRSRALTSGSASRRRRLPFPHLVPRKKSIVSVIVLVEDIDLGFLRNREDIENDKRAFLNDTEWQLLSVSSTYHILRSSTGNFAQIQFNVVIRRCPLAYVVSLLIPSIFLMLVDLGSFYLPPNCRARIVFKTNVLVGYTVFRVNMSDEVPRSAGCMSLIGVFFTVCMALLVLSLSKSILLIKFLHEEWHSGQDRPLLCLGGDSDADESRLYPRAPSAETTGSPVCQAHQIQPDTLKEAWLQLQSINNSLRTRDQVYQKEMEWLAILYHFDQLLFRIYLAVLVLYTVTLCTLWALWSRV